MSLSAMNRLATADNDVEHQFRSHAPLDRFDPTRTNVSPAIRKAIAEVSAIEAIVLTVDIRRSSCVLKESIDIPQYARILDDFVAEFRTVLHYHGGWFDKFWEMASSATGWWRTRLPTTWTPCSISAVP